MSSYTQSWYDKPRARTGSHVRLTQEDIDSLDDDAMIYSQRGEAPEGYYNAGTVEGGAGFGDHQVFKKLPEAKAPETNNEPVEEKESYKDKSKGISRVQEFIAPSQEMTDAVQRSSAYKNEMQDGDQYGAYGSKNSRFAERSKGLFDPNEGFESDSQTSVSPYGNNQAQSYMQDKLNTVKNKFNFQPTLS